MVVCFKCSLQMMDFYTAENGGLLQAFLANEAHFRTLEASLFPCPVLVHNDFYNLGKVNIANLFKEILGFLKIVFADN